MKRHQWMRGPAIVLLSFAMLCNVALQASADEEAAVPISKNDALRIASSILKLSNKFELADAELIYGPIWNMRGMTYGKDYLSGSTEFNVDATNGDILFYRKYDSRAKRSSFTADYSREKAAASATAFIAKAAPSLKGFALVEQPVSQSNLEIVTPLFGDASYLFSFGVTYKGIPIKDASVTIQLDGLGDIQYYNYAGAVGTPSAATRVKTVDEIRRTFADNLQVGLAYINRNNEWKLLYYAYGTSGTFDAVTGKDVNSTVAYLEYPDELTPVRIYGQSYSPVVVDTEEKAKAIASGRLLPQGVDWEALKDSDTWTLKGTFGAQNAFASIDAQSGRLLTYQLGDFVGQDRDEGQLVRKKITVGNATKIADRFMNEHVPRFSSEYQRVVFTDKDDSLSTQVYVRYQRVYKGIPVLGAGIYVIVNGSGEVIAYGSSGYEFENKLVEDLSPRINADRAKQIMVEAYRLKLIYSFDKNRRSSDSAKRPLALYYVAEFKEPYAGAGRYVDAVQGMVIKDELSEIVRGGPLPAVYQKHPSSKAMQLLYDHGVIELDENGKIYPDKAISRFVFWKMINVSLTRYTPSSSVAAFSDTPVGKEANNILMFAIQRGWLIANPNGKFNPNGLLTREQMAVWLTSVIGYGKLSFQFSEDPVVTRLKDAGTIKDKGAAAFMLKLGLMTADGGKFKPKAPVTLAEAAETFKRLAEKQNELDHPLYSYD